MLVVSALPARGKPDRRPHWHPGLGSGTAASLAGGRADSRELGCSRADAGLRGGPAHPAPAARGQRSPSGARPRHSRRCARLCARRPRPPALRGSQDLTARKRPQQRHRGRRAGRGRRSASGGGGAGGGLRGARQPRPAPLPPPRNRGAGELGPKPAVLAP